MVKKKNEKLLLFLAIACIPFFLIKCEKDRCPTKRNNHYMPDSQKALVPYETGDSLTFLFEKKSYKDTILFTGKKERIIEEDRELWGNCGAIITKYEQIHYDFYSQDSVHHLEVINSTKSEEIRIGINNFPTLNIHLFLLADTSRRKEETMINGNVYYDVFKGDVKYLYNEKYGLIKYRQYSKEWSLLKYH